jgi:hypothetical protein
MLPPVVGGHSPTWSVIMAAAPKTLDDMFHDMLKDVYFAPLGKAA